MSNKIFEELINYTLLFIVQRNNYMSGRSEESVIKNDNIHGFIENACDYIKNKYQESNQQNNLNKFNILMKSFPTDIEFHAITLETEEETEDLDNLCSSILSPLKDVFPILDIIHPGYTQYLDDFIFGTWLPKNISLLMSN